MIPPPWLLTLPVALPLAFGLLVLLLPSSWTHHLGRLGGLACALSVLPGLRWILRHGPVRQSPGGWGAPLGIDLYLDGAAGLFLLFSAVVGLGISFYAAAYFPVTPRHTRSRPFLFWPLWFVTWGAVQSLFLTLDLFNIYVTLELVSIAGVGLILVAGTPGATRAALQYQLQTLVAGLVYLLGVGLVYTATGTLDLHLLRDHLVPGPLLNTGMALMTAGLLVKAALFPVHFWLPRAHADSPAPVSAILSGLVVTTAFVVMSRIWFAGLRELAPIPFQLLLGGLGAAGIVWGGLLALQQTRLKRLLAYSTVSQVGYLFLVFALTFRTPPDSGRLWAGVAYLAVSHGLAKAAAFMAAGMLQKAAGTDQLDALRGASLRHPGAVLVLAVASINLIGLPPSLGFVGKWWILKTALHTGNWLLAAVILGGSLLAGAYLLRAFEVLRSPPPPGASRTDLTRPPAAVVRGMLLPAMGLALASLAPALFMKGPERLLAVDAPALRTEAMPEEGP